MTFDIILLFFFVRVKKFVVNVTKRTVRTELKVRDTVFFTGYYCVRRVPVGR